MADALVELIEDDSYNGTAMYVSREKGRFPVEFLQLPAQ